MEQVKIVVSGSGRASAPPETATAHVAAQHEGWDRERVYAAAVHTVGTVRASAPDGTIVHADQIFVRSFFPHDNGVRSERQRYTATVSMTATFDDTDLLSAWVADVAVVDGVEVGRVEWGLTDDTERRLAESARHRAAGQAMANAAAHAASFGLADLRIVAIDDTDRAPEAQMKLAARSEAVEFSPNDVDVTASITATFRAGAPAVDSDVSDSDIVRLELAVWDALVAGDGDADRALLADEFVGVYPTGMSDKETHVGQLAIGPSVSEYRLSEKRVLRIGDDARLLCYRAEYKRTRSDTAESMYVSSLWERRPDGWVNTFSQDTPADGTEVV